MVFRNYNKQLLNKIYEFFFWLGYVSVLITSLININGGFDKIQIGLDAFNVRLDHRLHFTVYLVICFYYLAGEKYGLSLFNNHPLVKFVLLIIFLAIATEVIQLWVSGRSFNVFDLLSNIAGVAAGVGVIRVTQGSEHKAQGAIEKKGY